jgi:hypothetical protein
MVPKSQKYRETMRENMSVNQPFQFPQELREITERNVEQARAAYGQFMDAMRQGAGIWMAAMPSNDLTLSYKVVQEHTTRFAKQNTDACFALVRELANAKDIQDVLGIQSRYAQIQMQTYASQAQEFGRLITGVAKGTQLKS